jgi:predicted DNA-binding protein
MCGSKKEIGDRQCVRLNQWMRQELGEICRETGAKASTVVRAALKKFIDDYNSVKSDQ